MYAYMYVYKAFPFVPGKILNITAAGMFSHIPQRGNNSVQK